MTDHMRQGLFNFDTALLNPRTPTAAENTCIGTITGLDVGTRCEAQLSPTAIQRVENLMNRLRYCP